MNKLNKKALWLSYFTVGYNLLEGVLSVGIGYISNSKAMIGFGIDSFIESLSASIMIWRFTGGGKLTDEEEERIEQKAVKFVAYTFFILGAYVLYESGKSLYFGERPEKSLLGIIILAMSIIVMPALAYLKYQTAKQLGSKSLAADAKQTVVCVFLSVVTLAGIGLNYGFGLWQLDPIAGLIIGIYLWREGREAYQGDID